MAEQHRMEVSIEDLQEQLRVLKEGIEYTQIAADDLGLQVVVRKKVTAEAAPEAPAEPEKKRKYTKRK